MKKNISKITLLVVSLVLMMSTFASSANAATSYNITNVKNNFVTVLKVLNDNPSYRTGMNYKYVVNPYDSTDEIRAFSQSTGYGTFGFTSYDKTNNKSVIAGDQAVFVVTRKYKNSSGSTSISCASFSYEGSSRYTVRYGNRVTTSSSTCMNNMSAVAGVVQSTNTSNTSSTAWKALNLLQYSVDHLNCTC